MLKIAVFDSREYDRPGFDKFSKGKNIELKHYETKLNADTVSLAKGYDGVVVFVNDSVTAEVIDRLCEYKVKLVALRCAGFNNVDLAAAKGRITVVRVPAYSPRTVAEHTAAMLLTSVRRIHKAYIRTRNFNFSINDFTGFELYGKTVGVIGTGKIGKAFIKICNGLEMNVVAYDILPDEEVKAEYLSLDELFERSDIISLHCPLTRENSHLINTESIKKMKRGVVILNTSRGGLIDTQALINGIKEKKIGAACLDVYEEESEFFFEDFSGHIVHDDTLARLLAMPNVIVTSHQAFLTREALENIAETTIDNIESFFGGRVKNQVEF